MRFPKVYGLCLLAFAFGKLIGWAGELRMWMPHKLDLWIVSCTARWLKYMLILIKGMLSSRYIHFLTLKPIYDLLLLKQHKLMLSADTPFTECYITRNMCKPSGLHYILVWYSSKHLSNLKTQYLSHHVRKLSFFSSSSHMIWWLFRQ